MKSPRPNLLASRIEGGGLLRSHELRTAETHPTVAAILLPPGWSGRLSIELASHGLGYRAAGGQRSADSSRTSVHGQLRRRRWVELFPVDFDPGAQLAAVG